MKNKELAESILEIAELLSLKGENTFRVRAYERASQAIESLSEPVEDVAQRGALTDIPGIGESVAEKISEYLATGKMKYLEELRKDFPEGLLQIMAIPGMGPKKAKLLYDHLKIGSMKELEEAAKAGRIHGIAGFGKKTEENILKGIELAKRASQRMLLSEAHLIVQQFIDQMKGDPHVRQISPAGSYRRGKETIGDLDILVTVAKGQEDSVIDRFIHLPQVKRVIAQGQTKISVLTDADRQVDLRIIAPESFGAALQYFTGSKDHNVTLRGLARDKGMTINEYGVFRLEHKERSLAGKTEEEVYRAMGMEYIPPELREDRGEIDAAIAGKLPKLVEQGDIRGDFHVHSCYSDGTNTIPEIAEAAQQRGYEWIVITDHSQSLKVAHGLSIETLEKKIREIRDYNSSHKGIRLLCGTEMDILEHGNIDYPGSILKELDFVIASIHSGFRETEEQMTCRIIRAIESPYVHCIGHPTGRLLNKRAPYAVNMEKVIDAAKANGKLIEINAFPDRLDLYDIYCKRAKEIGLKLCIGTDSHRISHLKNMAYGISVARRGWQEKGDIINTLSLKELLPYLGGIRQMEKV